MLGVYTERLGNALEFLNKTRRRAAAFVDLNSTCLAHFGPRRSWRLYDSYRCDGRSFALRRKAADFAEEIHHQRYVTLALSWFRALRRHQHDEALAVGSEIEVRSCTEVRRLFSGPDPRLVRQKRLPLHRVIGHHDPLVLGLVEQFTGTPRPGWAQPTGVGNLHLAAGPEGTARKGPHVYFVIPFPQGPTAFGA